MSYAQAVENQEEIEDERVFCRVKGAIEERLLQLIAATRERPDIPKLATFRQILDILGLHYPYVYRAEPVRELAGGLRVRRFTGRGTGGPSGLLTAPKVCKGSIFYILPPSLPIPPPPPRKKISIQAWGKK